MACACHNQMCTTHPMRMLLFHWSYAWKLHRKTYYGLRLP
nr:MAG TPA: Gonadotropin-releasing hormone [Bacteriophage sp.]